MTCCSWSVYWRIGNVGNVRFCLEAAQHSNNDNLTYIVCWRVFCIGNARKCEICLGCSMGSNDCCQSAKRRCIWPIQNLHAEGSGNCLLECGSFIVSFPLGMIRISNNLHVGKVCSAKQSDTCSCGTPGKGFEVEIWFDFWKSCRLTQYKTDGTKRP